MIGLFPWRDASNREMDALGIVVGEPFLPCAPLPQRILIIFFINRAMDPLHLAVPPGRTLWDEEMRQTALLAPGMKIPAEFAPVVSLDGDNGKAEIPFGLFNRDRRIPAFPRWEDVEVIQLRPWIEDRELVMAGQVFIIAYLVQV